LPLPVSPPTDDTTKPFAAPLAAAVRAHLTESLTQIGVMPRAGPGLQAEDARQITTAMYLALLELLEGRGRESRDAFIEDVMPACKVSGMTLETAIKGIARAYIVLVANVSHELSPDTRDAAGQWVGEFVGPLICDVVRVFGSGHAG
jgi:hypothetical protein